MLENAMDPAGSIPTELVYLAWSVVLLVVHIVLQGGLTVRELGLAYNAGARDAGKRAQGNFAQRAERNLRNFLETYPAFIGLALALAVSGKAGDLGAIGAALWFWARVAYVPLYLLGVPYVRSGAWALALAGLILMLMRLLG